MRIVRLTLVLLAALGGCQTPPPPPPQPVTIATPQDGEALVYLFRPSLDKVAQRESPSLLIDGRPIARLGSSSYTLVSLLPGRHELSIDPGEDGSRAWATEASFAASAGEVYFVAIWNPNQPAAPRARPPVPYGYGGAIGGAIIGLIQFFPQRQTAEPGAKLEPVDRQTGIDALGELRLVAASASHLAPLPSTAP